MIIAGGVETRLFPLTMVTSKQLLSIYDKPMIYYSLSKLMLADINEILIISAPIDLSNLQKILGDGHQFGIDLSYKVQARPDCLGQAFIISEDYIADEPCAMVLGDNVLLIEEKQDMQKVTIALLVYTSILRRELKVRK